MVPHTVKDTAAVHIWVHSILGGERVLVPLRVRARPCKACVRVVDTCRIMGGTLMDGVWVPPGTMERTSPSHHPSLSESFIAARCIHERYIFMYTYTHSHIYIYMYIYLPPLFQHSLRRTCVPHIRVSNELSNQSGFKSIASRDGRYAARRPRTHARVACVRTHLCTQLVRVMVSGIILAGYFACMSTSTCFQRNYMDCLGNLVLPSDRESFLGKERKNSGCYYLPP